MRRVGRSLDERFPEDVEVLNLSAPGWGIENIVGYADNRPSLRRCLALGRALGRAVASWDRPERVALIASGGLTHFVIDEELDRNVLDALERADEDALAALREELFQSGTGETKNWLPVAAAMNALGRRFRLVDYVPCYRTEAGTGNAMGFACWESSQSGSLT